MTPITGVNTGGMRKWLPTAVGVNLVLGIPGVVPVWLLSYFAVNWPLAAVGWTQREPTENDGMLPWLLLGGRWWRCSLCSGGLPTALYDAGQRWTLACTGR